VEAHLEEIVNGRPYSYEQRKEMIERVYGNKVGGRLPKPMK